MYVLCIWRCDHARFCVEVFICAIYKFSFIHHAVGPVFFSLQDWSRQGTGEFFVQVWSCRWTGVFVVFCSGLILLMNWCFFCSGLILPMDWCCCFLFRSDLADGQVLLFSVQVWSRRWTVVFVVFCSGLISPVDWCCCCFLFRSDIADGLVHGHGDCDGRGCAVDIAAVTPGAHQRPGPSRLQLHLSRHGAYHSQQPGGQVFLYLALSGLSASPCFSRLHRLILAVCITLF